MSESLKGIGLLIEVGTITKQVSTLMTEMYIAMWHLSVTITILVIVQIIGMDKIHAFVLHFFLWSTLTLRLCRKDNSQHQQTREYKQ
jgi:hypothetical protein